MTIANRASALFHTVSTTTKRANDLVDDVTDFARARFGAGIPLERSDVDLDAVAQRVAEERARAHPDRTIDVVSDGPVRSSFDARRMEQLLASLIGDAFDRSPFGTRVTATIIGRAADMTVRVHSSGASMGEEARRSLFRPFFRAERDRYAGQRTRGVEELGGVSLYLASKIAAAHGGRIDVACDSDGTTFTVVLPRVEGKNS